MAKGQNDDLDEKLYAAFWSKLQQAKFDIVYYSLHFNRYVVVSRVIRYMIIGATSLATGTWMTWNGIPIIRKICSIAILILQAISAVSEWFPYESRKTELSEMLAELEPLYINMENDWRSIYGLKMSNPKIQEAIQSYDKRQADIKRHYFKNDALPEIEKLRIKADEKTEEYFKFFK